ncbi:zinc-binding alcohol dehydrogenase family protein [Mucilaginibacter sp. Bleaf8]|uniref:zinc-binding alcohol dehydrogenase family protein n=1 Tax=Mucilaginibacter sp. Bleaf8 TaxID=2834430 RepID=UPI001BCA9260|nr:zinc-binding alcohol dehydrogenase family protein [Mucilaginibacter sp. Bleaf8]MBS7564719.1 zinc-binding alcohol dehydrogenase family protein [Mucilaginibacter sp. Bleaf8]
MKALVYRQKNTLNDFGIRLEEVADPEIRETDILVRVKAFGVNPGEAFFRRVLDAPEGEYRILGYEFSGMVEQVGTKVTGFNTGDRVFGLGDTTRQGAYAEFVAADYRSVAKIPDFAPFDHAAAAPVATMTAYQSLFRFNNALPPDVKTVLVLGAAGGVGSMAIQLLKAKTDVTVIATASKPDSQNWVKELGADIIIDHHADVVKQLKDEGINQVDFVFAVNGLKSAISWLPEVIRPYGYLATIEGVNGIDLSQLMNKSVTVLLEMVFSKSLFGVDQESQGDILRELIEFVIEGKVKSPIKQTLTGLSEDNIREAHILLEQGNTIGKIVVNV